jgi:hypothetical protein
MPNLTDTQRLDAIVKASNALIDAGEFRDFQHSATRVLLDGEQALFRNLNELKQSDRQPTKVDLNKRVYTASGTAKSATHAAAAFPDSFTKTITYLRKTQTFKVSYKQADDNRLSYDNILQYEMKNKLISLYTDLSTDIIAWLNTNRSQVATNSIMTFDTTNHKYDNTLANKDFLFEFVKSAQAKNKYNKMNTMIIGDQRAAADYRKLAANGRTNADNTEYQLPGCTFVEEPQMTIAADSTLFAFERGLVGMTTWNEPLNRRGHGSAGSNTGMFTTMMDPVFGYDLDVHILSSVKDTSSSAGNVQDVVDEYEIALTYALEGAWTDVANESHIFKTVQANS